MDDNLKPMRQLRPDEVAERAKLDAAVDLFARKMKQRLLEEARKGRKAWDDWTPQDALDRARKNVKSFQDDFDSTPSGSVPPTKDLVDAANWLMFGWYNAHRVRAETKS